MTVHHNASLLDCPVTEFLDRLAAKQPAPGGGGAAILLNVPPKLLTRRHVRWLQLAAHEVVT
jgi:hypothetical protein